jgi:hypothetical protein
MVECGLEDERKRDQRYVREASVQAGGLCALVACPAGRKERGMPSGRGRRGSECPLIGSGEAVRHDRVDDDERQVEPELGAQGRAELERLGDRISSAVDTATTAVRWGSSRKFATARPCLATGPTRAIDANVRGAWSIARQCPLAGASRTTRSKPRVRRWGCASSHTLPIVISSRMPGVAALNAANIRLRASTPARAPIGSRWRRYSSIALCGSIEMWCSRSETTPSVCVASLPDPPSARDRSSREATSTTIVRSPRCCAAKPNAAATVDFPTPPFPVTTSSERAKRRSTARPASGDRADPRAA